MVAKPDQGPVNRSPKKCSALICLDRCRVPDSYSRPTEHLKGFCNSIVHFSGCQVIGKRINYKDLRGSVRLFLRLLMTKDLAMKYSWSGFGAGRKKLNYPLKTLKRLVC